MQTSSSTKDVLVKLENQFWTAMCEDDVETVMNLTDFPSVLAGAQGVHAFQQEEMRKMFESGAGKIQSFEIDASSISTRELSPDTAVIAYKVKSTFEHEGKAKTVEAADTSTWVKRGDQWRCAMHTETELPAATTNRWRP